MAQPVETLGYAELARQAGLEGDLRELSRNELLKLRVFDERLWRTNMVIVAVVPELELAIAVSHDDAIELRLTDKVDGVHWGRLHVGQQLLVTLRGALAPQVVSAESA